MLPPFAALPSAGLHAVARVLMHTTCVGFAGLFLPFSLLDLPFFGVRESESLMNFASLGALTCICEARHAGEFSDDRRQSCRTCGSLVISFPAHLLDEPMTQAQVTKMTRLLREAGVRAKNLEIPKTIRNVHELMAYLDSKEVRKSRKPPKRPNARLGLVSGQRMSVR